MRNEIKNVEKRDDREEEWKWNIIGERKDKMDGREAERTWYYLSF